MRKHAGATKRDLERIYRRWRELRNRRTADPGYRESWYDEQCGGCRFWFPLAGNLGYDYGACANAVSPFDARVRFEHDGCEAFEASRQWAAPEDFRRREDDVD